MTTDEWHVDTQAISESRLEQLACAENCHWPGGGG